MKISIEKPKENIWKFPCLGISNYGTKVYFIGWEMGVVVESGDDYKIGHTSTIWDMGKFTPIDINGFELNKPKLIDWDKVELPIWAVRGEWIMKIENLEELLLDGLEFQESFNNLQGTRLRFCNKEDRNTYLNSLKILPKGTKITFEL